MITVELKTAEKTLTFNPSSIEIPAPGLNENLQHQEQSVSISAVYDPELLKLTATERDIPVTVRDDYTTIFTGRLSNNQSWQDNGRPTPIEKLSLSVSDNTYLLDRKTENIIALKNTTLAAVITRLCNDCNVTIAYPETLPKISMEFFVMEAGKKYKDVLDSVLIQHCYAYAFDGPGNLIIFDLNAELAKDPTPITEADLLTGVSVSQTTKDFSGAKVTYNPLLKKTNEQVYFEGNSLGSENTVTPITLRGGQYYPYDSDPVQEEREGQVYQTFASGYAESYTTYSGETKYQRSEKTTLLYTENHSLVKDWDEGIQVDRTQFEATRASVRFRNTTDGDRNLMQLAIRADAWYRNGDASVTSGDTSGSLYETDAEYIFTAEKAEKLAKLCSRFFCGRTFKITARLNQPVSPGGNYRIDTGSSGTQFTALAISCTYDPDDAIYSATFLSYGAILVDVTRFKETASGNPLDSVISEISNKLEGVISGQPEMGPPSPPKTLNAAAEEKGIQLSCVPEIVGVRNSLTAFKWEINKGNGWEQRESAEPSYFWQFDRSTDGYPEAADFATWRVRCYVISIYGKNSEYTPEQNINTDQYGTWKLLPPKITVSVSNRAINLKMEQPQRSDNRPVYGTLTHRIEVKNPKIDTDFFKPAESLDPYAAELNYKEGSGYVTAVLSYTQIMPLEGQNDDPPGPTYTLYQFRITAANEATTSEPTIQNATANPTSVYDMVKGWYKNEQGEKVKIPGALGAENIYTESLAAISANMGDITAGSISSVPEAGETKPNVLLDLDNEEFRIGNKPSLEDSGSEDAEYIHYTKGQGLVMKIKNFVVTALASIISGIFRVKAKGTADASSFFVVNPETTTDTPTSTKGKTVAIKGDINAVSASFAGKKKFEYSVPDLGGQERYICIADITDFWNNETGTNLPHYGFTGTITSIRIGGYMSEDIENISCRCGYSNPKKNNGLSIALFYGGGNNAETNKRFIPCIIEHLRDGKIYLAFKYHGSGKKLSLDGYFFNCLSDFLVLYNTDNVVIDELLMGSQWSFKDLTAQNISTQNIKSTKFQSDYSSFGYVGYVDFRITGYLLKIIQLNGGIIDVELRSTGIIQVSYENLPEKTRPVCFITIGESDGFSPPINNMDTNLSQAGRNYFYVYFKNEKTLINPPRVVISLFFVDEKDYVYNYDIPPGGYYPSEFKALIDKYMSIGDLRHFASPVTVTVNGTSVTASSCSYFQIGSSPGNYQCIDFKDPVAGNKPSSGDPSPESRGFSSHGCYVIYAGSSTVIKTYQNFPITISEPGITFL